MNLLTWIIFGTLVILTFAWFFLVRRDSRAYVESQVKALGEENRCHVDTKKLQYYFFSYAVCLAVVLGCFLVYFLTLL